MFLSNKLLSAAIELEKNGSKGYGISGATKRRCTFLVSVIKYGIFLVRKTVLLRRTVLTETRVLYTFFTNKTPFNEDTSTCFS